MIACVPCARTFGDVASLRLHESTEVHQLVARSSVRDPSVRYALDAILSRVRAEPAPSEEGEVRRAVAALVP